MICFHAADKEPPCEAPSSHHVDSTVYVTRGFKASRTGSFYKGESLHHKLRPTLVHTLPPLCAHSLLGPEWLVYTSSVTFQRNFPYVRRVISPVVSLAALCPRDVAQETMSRH